jgi:hypothetical protein
MRLARLKIAHRSACYHVICRITQSQPWLAAAEQAFLMELLNRVALYCGMEVLTFCIMSNHFHLLIRVPEKAVADAALDTYQTLHRVRLLYGAEAAGALEGLINHQPTEEMKSLLEAELELHRSRMHDLSVFMKLLKQRFTMWHNRQHGTRGTLWTERFKSVLIEALPGDRDPLQMVAAYIDLNPVRAGVVVEAKDYPYSGCGSASFASKELNESPLYVELINGGSNASQPATATSNLATILRSRQAAFVKGVVLGSANFVMEILSALRDVRRSVRPQAYATGGMGGDLWTGSRFRAG